jgi:hypothetical protein
MTHGSKGRVGFHPDFADVCGKFARSDRSCHRKPAWPQAGNDSGFVLAMVLALYVGFSRLNHLRFLEREPMLTGILRIVPVAAAMHLLAVSGLAASERGGADSPDFLQSESRAIPSLRPKIRKMS